MRRFGAASLDLALVAGGYWEMKLEPWDLAAGVPLVEEAGGRTTGWRGGPTKIYDGDVVASNGHLHQAILAVLDSTLHQAILAVLDSTQDGVF